MDFEDMLNLYLQEVEQGGKVQFDYFDDADFKYPVVSSDTDPWGVPYVNTYVSVEDVMVWFHERLSKIEEKLGITGD